MDVSITQIGDETEVRIRGELAIETLDHLGSLAEAMSNGTKRVVLNLAELSFVDSTGVNALLQSVLLFQSWGLPVRIENLRADLAEMLEVLGFFEVLEENPA